MIDYKIFIVIVGALIGLLGVIPYIIEIFQGTTKPNRITWLMWSIAPFIATTAALSNGVRWSVLPVFIAGLAPFLIFLSSLTNKKSYWKLEKFDYICGSLSLLALILWAITKQPNVAIIFAIISDAFAAIPTLVKSWKFPESETASAYLASLISVLTTFFVIQSWTFSALAFPVYLVLMDSSLYFSVLKGNNIITNVKRN